MSVNPMFYTGLTSSTRYATNTSTYESWWELQVLGDWFRVESLEIMERLDGVAEQDQAFNEALNNVRY